MTLLTDGLDSPPLRQYHLSGEVTTTPSLLPPELPLFVGRENALRMLRRRLLSGPRLVFLTGPNGIGKSALAVAVSHFMLRSGHFEDGVLWLEGREVLSYSGLLDEIARQLGQYATVGRSLEQRERHLMQQVLDHDYLLVVDDIDGLEDGRRHAITFLRQLQTATLLTARLHPTGLDLPERVEPLLLADVYQLLLADTHLPLDYEAVEDLLRQINGSPLAAKLVALRVATGDPPSELAERMLHAPTGELRFGRFHGQTPGLLRAFLLAWQRLDSPHQELLLAANCLTRSFSPALLGYMLKRSDGDELTQELEYLARWGFLERTVRGWRVHGALVAAIAGRQGVWEGWHLRAASIRARGTVEDQMRAIEHLRQGGDTMGAVQLLLERSDLLLAAGMASQLARQMATFSPDQLTPDLWLRLCEVQGDVAMRLGRSWEASHYFSHALSLLHEREPLVEARRRDTIRLTRKQAETSLEIAIQRHSPESYQQASLWIQRAMHLTTSEQADETVRLLLLQSHLREERGERPGAVQAADQALRLARRYHVNVLLVECYRRIGDLYRALHKNQIALATYDSALAIAMLEENPRQRASLLTTLGELQFEQGNWIEAAELLEDSLASWREASIGDSLAKNLYHLGLLLVAQGRYSEAQRYLQEAQIIARRAGLTGLAVQIHAAQAESVLCQGDLQLAEAMVQRSLDEAHRHMLLQPMATLFRLLASLRQQRNGRDEAARLWEEAAIWARRNDDPIDYARVLGYRALANRDPAQMEAALALLTKHHLPLETARLQVGLTEALVEQDTARARVHLVQAADTLARLGARPELERLTTFRQRLGLG